MPRRAFYDFSQSPYSYDFLSFLCASRALDCDEVVFVPGERSYQKCTPEERAFRLEHLLIPLAKMSGSVIVCNTREEAAALGEAVYPPGYTAEKPNHGHMFGCLLRMGKAKWLSPSARARHIVAHDLNGRSPTTITIRESRIKPLRNSSIGEWIKVAEWLKDQGLDPIFVPDTDNLNTPFGEFESFPKAAIDPDVRLALYSQAYLNLGINNGPMAMCSYSALPYLIFRMHDETFDETSAAFLKRNGLPVGSQFPWGRPHQRLVWEQDTAPNIIRSIEQWRLRRAA